MPESGEYVVTRSSPAGTYGYTEPPQVCWKSDSTILAASPEEIVEGLSRRTLEEKLKDVNGDQLPDRFVLVETTDKFILLLYRGAVHSGVWENCGGGSNRYAGWEPQPQLVGAAPKSETTKGQIVNWNLNPTTCPEKKREYPFLTGSCI